MINRVLLDTSFFIRLLNPKEPLHETAKGYFQYFLDQNFILEVSTIAIAEFCVFGNSTDLPLRNLMILPFNFNHAERAGKLMNIIYEEKRNRGMSISPRIIIPNDTKMFAQADNDNITYFVSSDSEAVKIYNLLASKQNLNFKYIDISQYNHNEYFGMLDLKC